jgi:hypothetical protein
MLHGQAEWHFTAINAVHGPEPRPPFRRGELEKVSDLLVRQIRQPLQH